MKFIDYLKALGVAVATLVITLVASYPMVAFYAWFIEPGHPQEFYVEAAQWIAPWSSHILGPLVFFAFNYFLAKRSPARNAMAFAVAGLVLYTIVDFSTIPAMGLDIRVVLTASVACWLLVKLLGAIAGAYFGQRIPKPSLRTK
jgi:hypothetical protein